MKTQYLVALLWNLSLLATIVFLVTNMSPLFILMMIAITWPKSGVGDAIPTNNRKENT